MHAFTVGTAGGLGFDDQVLQDVFAHDRIDHLVHPALGLCQGGCGHAEEERWLPHHPLKIGAEDLVDTFFRTGTDVVDQTQEDVDEGIRDFLGPYIAEYGEQGIADRLRMSTKLVEGFRGHPELKTSEIAGRQWGQQVMGEGEALELRQLLDFGEQGLKAVSTRVRLQGSQRKGGRRLGEHRIEQGPRLWGQCLRQG